MFYSTKYNRYQTVPESKFKMKWFKDMSGFRILLRPLGPKICIGLLAGKGPSNRVHGLFQQTKVPLPYL